MLEKENNTAPRVAFLHGRPAGHPSNGRLARTVGARFFFTDEILKYSDGNSGRARRYLSWVLNALFLPLKRYPVVLTESLRFVILPMRRLGRLGKRRKAVALICDETLYFLNTGYYKPSTQKAFLKLLSSYDGFICMGKYQETLLRHAMPAGCKCATTFYGTPTHKIEALAEVKPDLASHNMLLIANGPGGFRTWYKGLDLMLEVFEKAKEVLPDLTFTIVGNWSQETRDDVLMKNCPRHAGSVRFVDQLVDLTPELKRAGLYFHCARGEGWGISINEAMAAGLPAIVSTQTGAAEVVAKVSGHLITGLEPEEIMNKIVWYFSLSLAERHELSARGRVAIADYTEENSLKDFKEKFHQLEKELGLQA